MNMSMLEPLVITLCVLEEVVVAISLLFVVLLLAHSTMCVIRLEWHRLIDSSPKQNGFKSIISKTGESEQLLTIKKTPNHHDTNNNNNHNYNKCGYSNFCCCFWGFLAINLSNFSWPITLVASFYFITFPYRVFW